MLGQGILNWFSSMGLDEKTAGTWCSISLVFLSALLTGMAYIPGWQNGEEQEPSFLLPDSPIPAAPAVEYQKEGQVFGIGCKIFTIAGPVILYGTFASWILGILYYVIGRS